jgi:hypothetical protein
MSWKRTTETVRSCSSRAGHAARTEAAASQPESSSLPEAPPIAIIRISSAIIIVVGVSGPG